MAQSWEFPSEVTDLLNMVRLIPYENLSKIVSWSRDDQWIKVLDTPDMLQNKHITLGAGATCFSLTYFLYQQMREKGFKSAFLMADKYHFKNIHCGLLFAFEDKEFLLDPGYMIYHPMLIPPKNQLQYYPFVPNEICLENKKEDNVIRLYTGRKDNLKLRFDFRFTPVSQEEYFKHWKNSFYYDMMDYPILNRLVGDTQHYIQKLNYLKRSPSGSEFIKLDSENFSQTVKEVFGLSEDLIEESMQVLLQKTPDLF